MDSVVILAGVLVLAATIGVGASGLGGERGKIAAIVIGALDFVIILAGARKLLLSSDWLRKHHLL